MIEITQIFDPADLKDLIRIAFKADMPLLSKFHISPGPLDRCVEHTWQMLMEGIRTEKDVAINMAQVSWIDPEKNDVGVPIGYIVYSTHPSNILFSFGLSIQYRSRKIKDAFMQELIKQFDANKQVKMIVTLWDRNIRAIYFFKHYKFMEKFNPDQTTTLCLY